MNWLFDILQSMQNDPGATGGSFAGMVSGVFVLKRIFDYLIGKNKVDIIEAETDLAQTQAQLAPLEKVAEALLLSVKHFGDIASAIKDTVAALEKLTADSTEKHDTLQASIGQMELGMSEVVTMVGDVKKATSEDGDIATMVKLLIEKVDSLNDKVDIFIEDGRVIKVEAAQTKDQLVALEKRITQEQPVIKTETKASTTIEEVNIGKTQPIQPPNHIEHEQEEGKNDGKP